jgi:hypothetical protein
VPLPLTDTLTTRAVPSVSKIINLTGRENVGHEEGAPDLALETTAAAGRCMRSEP